MKLLQVDYLVRPGDRDAIGAAHELAQLPGLRWKLWISDASRGRGGGIYLFDDAEHAEEWAAAVPGVVEAFGGFAVDVRLSDVDETLTAPSGLRTPRALAA